MPISSRKGRLIAATSAAACVTALLLVGPGGGDRDRHLAHALDHADALGDADGAARVQGIKEVGALQHLIVGGEQGEALLVRRLRVVELDRRVASPSCRSKSFQRVAMSAISKL